MFVADPFGSWVEGAHLGLEDAAKMQMMNDAAMRNAYGLSLASQADPYHLQQLRYTTQGLGRQNQIEQNLYDAGIMQRVAQARAQREQLQPLLETLNTGVYGPYLSQLPQIFPNMQNVPQAGEVPPGFMTMVQGPNNTRYPVVDPYEQIYSPQRFLNEIRGARLGEKMWYDQARINEQEQRLQKALQQPQQSQGMSIFGQGIPKAKVQTTPPEPEEQNPYLPPKKQENYYDYGSAY
jgi:hypothetical protein